MPRPGSDQRHDVVNACLRKECSPREAAQRHGVSLRTVQRWLREESQTKDAPPVPSIRHHPRMRAASRLAGKERDDLVEELIGETLRLHAEAMDSIAASAVEPLERVDILSKLSQSLDRTLRALGKASPELSRLAVAKEVLERMALFVQARFPSQVPLFVDILEPFAAELMAEDVRE